MSDDPARYNAAAEQLSRASTVLLAVTAPSKVAAGGKDAGKAATVNNVENAAKGADNAADMIPATQLRTQLAFQEAGILDLNGRLTPQAVLDAKEVKLKDPIRNPAVVEVLTSDGSNISDWGKFTTKSVTMPNGQRLQIHFYWNKVTNKVDYITPDYKVKGVVKP
jgi:filamentous hemagglutinin